MSASPARRGLGPASALMTARMLAFAATFCIPMVLSRALTPEQFGTYKQAFLIYGTFYYIAQCGMAESLYYFIPGAKERARQLAWNAFFALGGMAVLSCLALFAGGGALARWMGNPALAAEIPLVAAYLALTLPATVLEIVLIAEGRPVAAAAAYATSDAIRAACLVLPVIFVPGVHGVMAGAVLFAALRLTACAGFLGRGAAAPIRPDRALLARQVRYAAPFGAAVLIEIFQQNLHQYVVSGRFDTKTFAIYAVGCLQVPFVDFVAAPLCNLMMVDMRRSLGADDPEEAAELFRETTSRIAMFVVPLIVWLVLMSDDLITVLFTPAYAAAAPVFRIWSVILGLAVLQTDGVLRVFAETRFLFALSVLKLVVTLLTIGPFIRTMGLAGAAMAPLVAVLLSKTVSLARLRSLLGVRIGSLLPWGSLTRTFLVTAAAACAARLAGTAARAPSPASLAEGSVAFVATLAAGWLALKLLDRPRPADVPSNWPRREVSP